MREMLAAQCGRRWCLAAQMDPGQPMLRAVAAAMAGRAADCNPQEISNTVWAFAKLRTRPRSYALADCLLDIHDCAACWEAWRCGMEVCKGTGSVSDSVSGACAKAY